jgi:hypothetical protein
MRLYSTSRIADNQNSRWRHPLKVTRSTPAARHDEVTAFLPVSSRIGIGGGSIAQIAAGLSA